MAHLHRRIQAFVKLGNFFREYCEYANNTYNKITNSNTVFADLENKIELAGHKNGWFTKTNVTFALGQWSQLLTEEILSEWLNKYPIDRTEQKTVAIIMAGNIPLVGFHDFLSALILGHKVLVKLSSNDQILLPFMADYLIQIEPEFKPLIKFQEDRLENFDVIIATGSDNTARYFDYYFKDKPSIIRRNRTSVAVLTGEESADTLQALGEDVFTYFGLGCRSVSKIYVPDDYNFDGLFNAMYPHKDIINLTKYANNYDYNKAVYLMSEFNFLDNGFLMLKEDENFGSPIATLFYEKYSSREALKEKLSLNRDSVQCIVANGLFSDEVAFGQTQQPGLEDYADGIDTVEFLLKTSHN
ncbi:acyl-CoA reductase [Muriicola sp. Z0-33]|uniref:acyl-CoA reductase n=1 Tax=Muriicola sp. Z0-33 TaxID=2816957 RepID=UPI002237C05F|nr:acyl-CoA reductase [Muriicola sp. Z0-33]MCW5516676.1 acyl-CoA reductase [Muriicola sp. Z0-33]